METSDGFEIRCGEVFLTRQKLYIFHCSLCHDKYHDFSSLVDHISEAHYIDIVWSDDEIEHTNVEQLQESYIEWDEQSEDQNFDIKSEANELENDQFNNEELLEGSEKIYDEQWEELTVAQDIDSEDEYTTELHHKVNRRNGLNLKTYQCTICRTNFKKKNNLQSHIMHIHSDERKFKCDQCNRTFKTNSNLHSHQRRHANIRKFGCSHCPKKFHTCVEARTHERTHTGEKPYVCTQCGRAFSTSGLLTEHMKRHNNYRPYKCEYCEKTFYSAEYKKCHLVIHTGERKHNCNVCNAAFARRKTLVQHMKIHINARENKCEICDAAFNQKPALIAHMKSKHKLLTMNTKLDFPQT